jgi:riboflavin kinase/FMN adenylyltransferase
MHLYRHITDVTAAHRRGVIAIGNFDGVHLGHRAIIGHGVQVARDLGAPSLVLTFEPHPRQYFAPDSPPFRLTPLRTKVHEIERLGVDALLVLAFDAELVGQSAAAFVEQVLVAGLACRHVVTGADFCFGQGRQGTPEFLLAAAARHGFGLTQLPLTLDTAADAGGPISSSRIRAALVAGQPQEAAALLGRPWVIEGRVVHGQARGRQLGFSTANVLAADYLQPKFGVYAVDVRIEDEANWRPGVANFGLRPTVDGSAPTLEVHLLDFDGDLYHRHLTVAFLDYIRPEQKFASLDALRQQIAKDCQTARNRLK